MDARVNNLTRFGAAMFVLWGIGHGLPGAFGAIRYATGGAPGILSYFGSGVVAAGIGPVSPLAGKIAFELSILLLGTGLFAILSSIYILGGSREAFWLSAVTLLFADAGFVYSLLIPRYVPLAVGIEGPILYLLGLASTAYGMYGPHVEEAIEKPREAEAPPSDRKAA